MVINKLNLFKKMNMNKNPHPFRLTLALAGLAVSTLGSHAQGIQSSGERPVAVSRFGGSAVAADDHGERLAAN